MLVALKQFFIKTFFNLLVIGTLVITLVIVLIGLYHAAMSIIADALPSVLTVCVPALSLCLAGGVIFFTHPVHSLLALIVIFFSRAVLYLRAGAEFLAFTFLIVYVGAIAILFLFVIRLLNIKELTSAARQKLDNLQKRACVLAVIASPRRLKRWTQRFSTYASQKSKSVSTDAAAVLEYITENHCDVRRLSALLYSYYSYLFALIALLLLTARLGAIVLATSTVDNDKAEHTIFTKEV